MSTPPVPAQPSEESLKAAAYFFVIDVESVGLHGEPFAVGWSVFSQAGGHYEQGYLACPMGAASGTSEDREWCEKNIPAIRSNRNTPIAVRDAFWPVWEFWKKEGAVLVADCGWPVEARFLALCVDDAPKTRNWGGPYPMHDVASVRMALGFDPLATLPRTMNEVPAHHPMHDARQSGRLLCEALAHFATLRAQAAMAGELADELLKAQQSLRFMGDHWMGKVRAEVDKQSAQITALLARFSATKSTKEATSGEPTAEEMLDWVFKHGLPIGCFGADNPSYVLIAAMRGTKEATP